MKISKRRNFILNSIKFKKLCLEDSLIFLKKYSLCKFNESIDISIKLSSELKKHNEIIKGSIFLPYNVYKNNRILVFAEDTEADIAMNIGIQNIGTKSLINKINSGFTDFDVIFSTSRFVSQLEDLSNFLIYKNLNFILKKIIIVNDIGNAIYKFKSGVINFKSDKYGCVNFSIGKSDFKNEFLKINFIEVINFFKKIKPIYIKKHFITNISLSSTMGIGISIILDKNF